MQCVTFNKQMSDLLPVVSGVPQGSILGPLIFVTDLPETVTSLLRIFLFSDDIKCLLPVKEFLTVSLQQDLYNLSL